MNSIEMSVIIPTQNQKESLLRVLKSLTEQDYPFDRFEVLVINDGSLEPELQKKSFPYSVRFFAEEHLGYAHANNVGIQNARGNIVLFLDDHMVATPSLLSQHSRCHAEIRNRVVIGQNLEQPSIASKFKMSLPENATCGPNTSVHLEHLRELGGFDEEFYHQFHAVEMGRRLYLARLEFVYNPKALAHHYFIKRDEEIPEEGYWAGRESVLLLEKHPQFRTLSPLNRFFQENPLMRMMRKLCWHFPQPAEAIASLGSSLPTSGFSTLKSFLSECNGIRELRPDLSQLKKELFQRVPILEYHYIGELLGNYPDISVSSKAFEDQMCYLVAQGYQSISLDEWIDWKEHGTPLPDRPVVITFDDGYECVYQKAFPVLKRLGLKASVFTVVGRIGQTNTWDKELGYDSLRLLSVEQMKEMNNSGIDFQSHGLNHILFSKLHPNQIREELSTSKKGLESILNHPVNFIAYPYGYANDSIVKLAKETGFRGGCMARGGISSEKDDPYCLNRVPIGFKDSLLKFKIKLLLGEKPALLRSQLKRLLGKKSNNVSFPFKQTLEMIREIE